MSGNLEADGGAKRGGRAGAVRVAAVADTHEEGGVAAISRRSPIPSCVPILINPHTGFRSGESRIAHSALGGGINRRTEQLTFGRKEQHIGTGMLASLAIHALVNGRLNQLSPVIITPSPYTSTSTPCTVMHGASCSPRQ